MKQTQKRPKVVIIGAGFGGIKAAQGLKKVDASVTVIDRRNHHLFQPLLYQVATAGLSAVNISVPIRLVLKKHLNTEVLMEEVIGIDLDRQQVFLNEDRRVDFDYLIIATGAFQNYFGKPEWEQFAPGIKSVSDAIAIRDQILTSFEKAEMEPDPEVRKRLMTFILIGAGPTGVEMAGAIADLAHLALKKEFRNIDTTQSRILLLEAGSRILSSFPEKLVNKARRDLEKIGVEVKTNSRVQNINEEGVHLPDQVIPSANVIWTAGVSASPAGKWLHAQTDRAGRVIVENDQSVPGHPNIFVIGDTAAARDENDKPYPGVAPVAMQQGTYVASLIRNRIDAIKNGRRELKSRFHYLDKGNLATIGRAYAIADIRGIKADGFIGWIIWAAVHILYLITFRNRILVILQWAFLYLTYQRGGRLIVTSEGSRPKKAVPTGKAA